MTKNDASHIAQQHFKRAGLEAVPLPQDSIGHEIAMAAFENAKDKLQQAMQSGDLPDANIPAAPLNRMLQHTLTPYMITNVPHVPKVQLACHYNIPQEGYYHFSNFPISLHLGFSPTALDQRMTPPPHLTREILHQMWFAADLNSLVPVENAHRFDTRTATPVDHALRVVSHMAATINGLVALPGIIVTHGEGPLIKFIGAVADRQRTQMADRIAEITIGKEAPLGKHLSIMEQDNPRSWSEFLALKLSPEMRVDAVKGCARH